MRRKVHRVARELRELFYIYHQNWWEIVREDDFSYRKFPGKGFGTNAKEREWGWRRYKL